MAKTKDQLRQELLSKLSSNLWQTLQTSLIGRELISYATELLYAVESVKSSISSSLYVEPSDIKDLISKASLLDIPLQCVKPAFVKILVESFNTRYFSPFSLKFVVGSSVYTNIDYCSSDNPIYLYQGQVFTSFSSSEETSSLFYGFRVDQSKQWELFSEYTTSEYYSHYIKLSDTAFVDSVRVFKKGSSVSPIPEYNPISASSEIASYKVRCGWDSEVVVKFGNSLWGSPLDLSDYTYQVMWLNLTTTKINPVSGTLTYTPPYTSTPETLTCSVISHESAIKNDLVWVANNIRAVLAEQSAIVTKSQIKDFTNSRPGVVDSSPVVTGPNKVTVYIKPSDSNDYYFSDIEDRLNLYGEMVTTYSVERGRPFLFTLLLSCNDSLTAVQKNGVVSMLENELSYSKLGYDTVLSISDLSSKIVSHLGKTVNIDLKVLESVTELNTLTFPPKVGTLDLLSNGVKIGWDGYGIIYIRVAGSPLSCNDSISAGSFLLSLTKDSLGVPTGLNILNPANLLSVDGGIPLNDLVLDEPVLLLSSNTNDSSLGYLEQILLSNEGAPSGRYKVVVYSNDDSFDDGDLSIQRMSKSYKPPFLSAEFDARDWNYFDYKNVVIRGREMYNVSIVDTLFIAQKWYYSYPEWSQIYYNIQSTVESGTKIMGVYDYGGNLFIVTNKVGKHLVIENFETVPVLYTNMSFTGLNIFDETELLPSAINSAIIKIGNYIVWTTGSPIEGSLTEDTAWSFSLESLFDSKTVPSSKSFEYDANAFNTTNLRLVVHGDPDNLVNLSYTVSLTQGSLETPLQYFDYLDVVTEDLVTDSAFVIKISVKPEVELPFEDLRIKLNIKYGTITSTVVFNTSFYSSEEQESRLYISPLPVFDSVNRKLVINGAPLRVYDDLFVMASSISIPISVVDDVLYSRLKIRQGTESYIQTICVVAYDLKNMVTRWVLFEGETVTTDNLHEIYTVEQVGTIDYPTGTLSLDNAVNYQYSYRTVSSNLQLTHSNYPVLDEVLWE